ncbi:unnamed protein product [Strongylus vulgaris]|uniref:Uncharacterized protein n=1 Tax=Strongylus vulgaris TaxID=40348 RepID=A0A3P7J8A0_STRVU|nr:unnamed protein product [Strongylus vulgaris]
MSTTGSSSMASTISSASSEKTTPKGGFQELQTVKKKVTAPNKGPQSENVNIDELMKALKVVRKAKERNVSTKSEKPQGENWSLKLFARLRHKK